jgi:PKD repeat protein
MIKKLLFGILIIFLLVISGCFETEFQNDLNNQEYDFPTENYITITNENNTNNNSKLNNEVNIETIKLKIVYGEICNSKSLSYSFRAVILENGSNSMTYDWDFGDNTSSQDRNPTHNYKKSGKYIVKLMISDKLGKIGTALREINVIPNRSCPCN